MSQLTEKDLQRLQADAKRGIGASADATLELTAMARRYLFLRDHQRANEPAPGDIDCIFAWDDNYRMSEVSGPDADDTIDAAISEYWGKTTTCPGCGTVYYNADPMTDCIAAIGVCGACGMRGDAA